MSDVNYRLVRATAEDIQWIGKLEKSVYSGSDAVPVTVLLDWYNNNPDSFWLITLGDKIAGHIDILPVRDDVLKKFIDGSLTEPEIHGTDIYSPSEKERIRDLYIESLAIDLPEGFLRAKALLSVLTGFKTITESICNPDNINNIYAISATDEGSALLTHLGFHVFKKASERKDKHDLFKTSFPDFTANWENI